MSSGTSGSSSAIRALQVLHALRGHTLDGVSNAELAKGLGVPAPAITRALAALINTGYAVKLDNGRFAPSIALLQQAMAHADELARASDRINELKQRIAAGARR